MDTHPPAPQKKAFQLAPVVKNPLPMQEMQEMWVDPWVGKIPGVGNSTLVQYSCLENFMGRGGWRATIHEVTKTEQLSAHKKTQNKKTQENVMYTQENTVNKFNLKT